MPRMRYRTIVADPPWPFSWSGGASRRRNGRGEIHGNAQSSVKRLAYPTMSLESIAALAVADLVETDAALFMWIPDRLLLQGAALPVVEAWGFANSRLLIWEKSGFGLGTFPRGAHEVCVVATRGRSIFRVRNVGSVQQWNLVYETIDGVPRRKHSAKPDGFLDLVERACPGPYLELFARRQRLGWDTWGNEALEHVEIPA